MLNVSTKSIKSIKKRKKKTKGSQSKKVIKVTLLYDYCLFTQEILESELIKVLGKSALYEDWDTIPHSEST